MDNVFKFIENILMKKNKFYDEKILNVDKRE